MCVFVQSSRRGEPSRSGGYAQEPAGKPHSNTAENNLSAFTAPEQQNHRKINYPEQISVALEGGEAVSEGPTSRAGDAQHGRAAASAEPASQCCPRWERAVPHGFGQNKATIYRLSCSAILALPTSSPPGEEQEQGQGKELEKRVDFRERGKKESAGAAPALQKAGFTALCQSLSHPYCASTQSNLS